MKSCWRLKRVILDAVSICTYNAQHAPCAIHALEAGVNVMLEKPFTVTLDEAIEVMRAERKSGKILTIGFQPRMSPNMQMIKKIIDSGEAARFITCWPAAADAWHSYPRSVQALLKRKRAASGASGDIGTYSLDMLLQGVGYPKPLTVSGYNSAFFGQDPDYYDNHPEYAAKFGVDDFSAAFVRLEGDIILDFRISWAMHMDTCGDALILGTKAGMKIPSTECWNGDFSGPIKIFKNAAGQPIEYEVPLLPTVDVFYEKLRSFIDSVKEGGKATVPSSQIIYNQAIIDGITKSAALGKEVDIVIPEL